MLLKVKGEVCAYIYIQYIDILYIYIYYLECH